MNSTQCVNGKDNDTDADSLSQKGNDNQNTLLYLSKNKWRIPHAIYMPNVWPGVWDVKNDQNTKKPKRRFDSSQEIN